MTDDDDLEARFRLEMGLPPPKPPPQTPSVAVPLAALCELIDHNGYCRGLLAAAAAATTGDFGDRLAAEADAVARTEGRVLRELWRR